MVRCLSWTTTTTTNQESARVSPCGHDRTSREEVDDDDDNPAVSGENPTFLPLLPKLSTVAHVKIFPHHVTCSTKQKKTGQTTFRKKKRVFRNSCLLPAHACMTCVGIHVEQTGRNQTITSRPVPFECTAGAKVADGRDKPGCGRLFLVRSTPRVVRSRSLGTVRTRCDSYSRVNECMHGRTDARTDARTDVHIYRTLQGTRNDLSIVPHSDTRWETSQNYCCDLVLLLLLLLSSSECVKTNNVNRTNSQKAKIPWGERKIPQQEQQQQYGKSCRRRRSRNDQRRRSANRAQVDTDTFRVVGHCNFKAKQQTTSCCSGRDGYNNNNYNKMSE